MSSRDLFAVFKDLLVNIKDFLVIFDPTKGISINNHLLLPINSPHGEEVGDLWPINSLRRPSPVLRPIQNCLIHSAP